MARESKSDLSIVLRFLREGLGWSQVRLEKAAGLPPHTVNDLESGQKELRRGKLELMIARMGLGPERIDAALNELAAARADSRSGSDGPFAAKRRKIEALAARVGRFAASFARAALELLTLGGEALHARDRADALWRQLKKYSPEDRLMMRPAGGAQGPGPRPAPLGGRRAG